VIAMRVRIGLTLGLLAAGAVIAAARPAHAVRFRRPHNTGAGVNYGFDHNGGGGGCVDFACGGVCYDGHTGNDFPISLGTDVVAAADGVVIATNNGCSNYGGYGNTCGGRCGNYVQIDHGGGVSTIYCHMQLDSIVVGYGQHVSCGQRLGASASSGSSTGPHLHFGVRSGGSIDPFAGKCSGSTSWWVDQGGYPHNVPSAQCEVVCECSPGEVQHGGCGNCGHHQRSCGGDCHWGGWSECVGQGECAAGSIDSRSCCDCGTQTRACSAQCHWGPWGECAGPDPNGGNDACETGEPGICAEGRVRCRKGCLACVRIHEPRPERCDDVDEDCDGAVDNGHPQQMGDPGPLLAARLLDASFPPALGAGKAGLAWAAFRNEGRQAWKRDGLWLVAVEARKGHASRLFDSGNWPAFDVAAVLDRDVPPGQDATFVWSVRPAREATGTIEERFQLVTASGTELRCPSPDTDVRVRIAIGATEKPAAAAIAPEPAATPSTPAGCGCGVPGSGAGRGAIWAVIGVMSVMLRRRRIFRAARPPCGIAADSARTALDLARNRPLCTGTAR
jgi:hypothetical protein